VALVMLSGASVIAAVSESHDPEESASPEQWKPEFWLELRLNIRQGFVAATGIQASDDLSGLQVGYGIRGDSDEFPVWGGLWLSSLSGNGQRVIGARGDMKLWLIAWSRGGVGPLLGLGLEHRSEPPRAGFGGYLALGAEVTVWSRWHWQISLDAERDFGISSKSRNQIGFTIAYAHDRLTAGPDHD
jgi:hypothetical protein